MAELDFNIAPYFDDYDEDKKFVRILFRPGVAVQARELTQLQTTIQKQIERFGHHIFENGTIIDGGNFDIEDSIDYVRVSKTGIPDISIYIGEELTGAVTGLIAYVTHAEDDEDTFGTAILYVRYKNSTVISNTFVANETLTGPATSLSVLGSSPVGKGSLFGISEGVAFVRGFFVKFDSQKVTLEKFSTNPSRRVYFNQSFVTVSADEDPSLLDNSQGSPNFTAAGADRLKAELTLVSVPLTEFLSDENHSMLFEVENGAVRQRKDKTEYNKIGDELAKRTYDESGDYVVRGFTTYTRDHLDTGSNGGRLPLAAGGDATLLSVGVETGLAYVKGYEISSLLTKYIDVQKSTDFIEINNQVSYVRSGNYTEITEISGLPNPDVAGIVNLYDTAETRATDATAYDVAVTGLKIGEARINSIIYESGILGDPDAVLRLYIHDIQMNSNSSFSDVRSVGNANFFADVVVESGNAVLKDAVAQNRLYYIGSDHTKRIKDSGGSSDTTFLFYRRRDVTIATGGTFSVTVVITDEGMPYGSSALNSLAKRSLFLQIDEPATITVPGTISGTIAESTVTGVSTFFTRLNVGDRIKVTADSNEYIIAAIGGDTSLTVVGTLTATFAASAYTKEYKKGDLISLSSKGATAGAERIVTPTSTTLTVDLGETFPSAATAKFVHQVFRSSANEITKNLRPNRFVKIDCSALSDLTKIYLGFSDVYKIRQVREHSAAFTLVSDGVDVTSNFTLNTGQTEAVYKTSCIIPKTALTSADFLLVELDYFEPDFSTGVGYFSVDSYPINDSVESSTTIQTIDIPRFTGAGGTSYNLRNYIDTRPVFEPTAADATTVGAASVNPIPSVSLYVDTNGLRNPIPGSNFTFDYSFYLARRDIVAVDSRGEFSIVQGVPAINPYYPTLSSNYMGIANLYVPPYPTISGTRARIENRVNEGAQTYSITYSRHTMRDIGVIKSRVKNLEYYNALNLLEKSALDMLIPDETGLDRFKNGVFVDGFIDHSLGDTEDPEYSIAIDKQESVIRPIFDLDGFGCGYNPGASTGEQTGNLITAPYNEITLITQPNATTVRNIEQSVFRFIGTLEVFPHIDTWVDTTTVDRTVEYGNRILPEDLLRTEWGSWETYSSGANSGSNTYNVYNRQFGDRSGSTNGTLLGTFGSYAEAVAASARVNRGGLDDDGRTVIETVTSGGDIIDTTSRTGTQTSLITEDQYTDLGNFVTNTSLIPYIRPQSIRLYARGLKANTRMYVYFDGEDMTDYCIPVTIPVSGDLTDLSGIGEQGDNLVADIFGELLCYLVLPESGKQFRVGTKDIVVTDSPTNAVDATTYARDAFVAAGLNVSYQNTILSTQSVVGTETELLSETFSTTRQTSSIRKVEVFGPSCMAYSFFVNLPENVPGVFLTSVDVFVESMSSTLGMWFEIREMDNSGGITRTQVPFSEVWMKRDDARINLTADATTATNVNFPAPIFLYNDRQYAFVIHTEGLNPDTYFWVSRLGESDIRTGSQVVGRQLTGTLFTTNNNLNWDIVPDVDMRVNFNVANFNTNVTYTNEFTNDDYEFIDDWVPADDLVGTFIDPVAGEPVKGSDILTIINAPTLVAGDIVIGTTSNVEAEIISVGGGKVRTKGHDFLDDEPLTFKDSSNAEIISSNSSVSVIENGFASVRKKGRNNRITLQDSNGLFFEGGVLKTQYTNKNTRFELVQFGEHTYTALNLRPGYVALPRITQAKFKYAGITSVSVDALSEFQPQETIELNASKRILSRSKEVELLGGEKSFRIVGEISTTSNYVSPMLDDDLMNAVFITNICNDDDADEDLPANGLLESKYISKVITLAENQDAEDLLVFLKEYRPPGADVKVWVRIKNKYDIQNIKEKDWVALEPTKSRVSSVSNKSDFVDATYSIPVSMLTGTFDEIQYEYDGNTFTGFKQFQIKIGMLTDNIANYPKAAQLRAIALQK